MRTDELDFELPLGLIAQAPPADRAAARLLHYRREGGEIAHRGFAELPGLLRRDDLLVFNDTKVLAARFVLVKETGGRIEGLFLREIRPGRWEVLLKGMEGHRGVMRFAADESLSGVCEGRGAGVYEMEVTPPEVAESVLGRVGRMPLPPYIKRGKEDPRDALDRERYQTIYARTSGSVAAPTAGLHFTPAVLAELEEKGIERASVTLHVGLGTFRPVNCDVLEQHVMHRESYEIGEAAAETLNRARRDGRRIVAVGTTSARVLESFPADHLWRAGRGETEIFIYPPYSWRHVGGLMTNFHLPRSTLIALVAAWVGLAEQRRIYGQAIERGYRFFSYGDAMLAE